MAREDSSLDSDLFGNPVSSESLTTTGKPRQQTNDMDLIERVLQVACVDGYALVGSAERVYRVGSSDQTGTTELIGIPTEEANAVHQLIDNRDLVVGGQHRYRYRNYREGYGRAVLVPRQTQQKRSRWAHLHRPSTWGTPRTGKG